MTEWERCSPWLQAALDHASGDYTLADVLELVRKGDAQFWAGRQSAIVTQVDEYPHSRVLTLWLGGGDLRELSDDLIPRAETFGRECGCTRSRIIGRQGWARALAGDGYRPVAAVVEKVFG
jgi:hypothetical protein